MTTLRRLVWAVVPAALALAVSAACATDVENPAVAQGTEPSAAEATDVAPTTTTTPVPPGGRQPTPADPLRVVLAGDSVMNGLAPAVATALNEGGDSQVQFDLAPSIARDTASRVLWQQQLETTRPDLVVMLIGTWERGDANFQPGHPNWAPQYQAQVLDPFAEMVTDAGAQILWIGMPAVESGADTLQLVALNSQFRALAERDDDVDYVEGGDYLNGPDGGYTDRLPGADGTLERVRRLDGLHLCPEGSERLAVPVLEYAQQQWNVAVAPGWETMPWREPPTLDKPEECPPV
ncbi:MAG TPA: hypothetical protein PKA98_05195 [Acidimicrobiales bacterium]|nr:hypothetical protein [Acidimicrobiales bacterium]